MGGQNHQPTNRVLTGASALLSKYVSDGFSHVLRANSSLEDAIILGMDRLHVRGVDVAIAPDAATAIEVALDELRAGARLLPKIDEAFAHLLDAADLERYVGNPLASQVGGLQLLDAFTGVLIKPTPNIGVWRELESHVQESNVLSTLEWQRSQFQMLEEPLRHLIVSLQQGLKLVRTQGARAFVDALEDNELPLRYHYAQVFSLWNHLHCLFLYSSLLMTELYYRANGFPSLVDSDVRQRPAVA